MNMAATTRQARPSITRRAAASPRARPERGGDDVELHEGHDAEGRQAGGGSELLGGADVAHPGGECDAGPDRPAGDERGEKELDEAVVAWREEARLAWADRPPVGGFARH